MIGIKGKGTQEDFECVLHETRRHESVRKRDRDAERGETYTRDTRIHVIHVATGESGGGTGVSTRSRIHDICTLFPSEGRISEFFFVCGGGNHLSSFACLSLAEARRSLFCSA